MRPILDVSTFLLFCNLSACPCGIWGRFEGTGSQNANECTSDCLVACLVSMCGSVLMMHLLVSKDSEHMVTLRPAGPFDLTQHTHTLFLKFPIQILLHTHTHSYSYAPDCSSPRHPLVLWWLVLMSLPNDLAHV